MNVYLVGGSVRDLLCGVRAKDRDFAAECTFPELQAYVVQELKCEIIYEVPSCLTIRARRGREILDFACCRKDVDYDGRRPDRTEYSSLYEDLKRRDFTINAMAIPVDENLEVLSKAEPLPTPLFPFLRYHTLDTGKAVAVIDFFEGMEDLQARCLRFVGNPYERLEEDGLRWLRAIRFCITRGFQISPASQYVITHPPEGLLDKVSVERIQQELEKCFALNTHETMKFLAQVPPVWIKDGLWLMPTTRKSPLSRPVQ